MRFGGLGLHLKQPSSLSSVNSSTVKSGETMEYRVVTNGKVWKTQEGERVVDHANIITWRDLAVHTSKKKAIASRTDLRLPWRVVE